MAIPTAITDLSATISSNVPADTEQLLTSDDYLRALSAFIRQNYDTLVGGQFVFPATQNASSNANTLDDYEEGTFTPADASGATLTLTVKVGSYTKIGRLVFARVAVAWPVNADATAAKISLPFTSSSYGVDSGMAVARTDYGSFLTVDQESGTASVIFRDSSGAQITNAGLSGKVVYFSGCYEV